MNYDLNIKVLKGFEGCKLEAYLDGAGVWTIGYGHIINVKEGDTCTQEQADAWLQAELIEREVFVLNILAGLLLSDNQYAALVSFCYNEGNQALKTSTLLKKVLEGDFQAAADAFLMWDKIRVDGVLVHSEGLENRRKAERAIFLS